jgi:predicted porin
MPVKKSLETIMKTLPKSLGWCLAAFACANVHAQSTVEVYGLLDLNVGVTSNTAKEGGNVVRVSSSGMNTSRLGFRGGEDLGNGLKAVYQLEMGLVPDVGGADNPLFKRQANVGLEGRYGRVVVGRSFTSVYDFMQAYDPLSYAPAYSWAPTGNGSGPSKYGMTAAFDNLVKYTGKAGGFTFGATYGAGEQTSSTADGAKGALAVNYASGPFGLVATYEKVNGNLVAAAGDRDVTTAWHLGALVNVGKLKLQAAMRDYKLDPANGLTPEVRARLYWAGANYLVSPVVTVSGAVYYQDVLNVAASADADPAMLVGRIRYAMSKRTDLYAVAAYAKARHGQVVSLARDEAGFGSNQRSAAVGMQHRF